jgi:hypothetical protein
MAGIVSATATTPDIATEAATDITNARIAMGAGINEPRLAVAHLTHPSEMAMSEENAPWRVRTVNLATTSLTRGMTTSHWRRAPTPSASMGLMAWDVV